MATSRKDHKISEDEPEARQAEIELERSRKDDETLKRLVKIGVGVPAGPFFDFMTKELAKVLEADYVLIGELADEPEESVRTLSVVTDGEVGDNFRYDLCDTPCENVISKGVCSYLSDVANLFPKDTLLKEMNVEAYIGIPLFGSTGAPMGIIAALFRSPLENGQFAESIIQVFSSSAASEMERIHEEQKRLTLEAQLRQ